jgi:hypothetical protein
MLMSFPYWTTSAVKQAQKHQQHLRVLVDSGAFTAWKAGGSIQLDDYCRFLDKPPVPIWRYFVLDVIGDPVATFANYQTMRKRGLNPIPIFTRGDDVSRLNEYYDTSDVVAVGGLVGTPNALSFLNGIMKHVGERKVHWLGITRHPFLVHYRPFSCDSSNYNNSLRYGRILAYMPREAGLVELNREHFRQRPAPEIRQFLAAYGVDPRLLTEESAWRTNNSLTHHITTRSLVAYAMAVWQKLGTLLFFAVATHYTIPDLVGAYLDERAGNPIRWR